MIDRDALKTILDYDLNTGVFVWREKISSKVIVGRRAGCKSKAGYILIRIHGVLYLAHRLAWLYVYGDWPEKHIDHKNKDRGDNRICNLRLCNDAENGQNCKLSKKNTSGKTGVCFNKRTGKWFAQIFVNRKRIGLGSYDSFDLAVKARAEAKSKFHTFNPTD